MTDAPTPPDPYRPDPSAQPWYPAAAAPSAYAHWGQRVGAYVVDALVPIPFYLVSLVGVGLMVAGMRSSYDATGNEVTHVDGLGWFGIAVIGLGYVGAIVFSIGNVIFRQGRTGWSIGKKVLGIRLVGVDSGQPIGALRSFVRQLAHFFDGLLCYLGYLWPLWDQRRQTFADKLLGSVVVVAQEPKG